MRRRFMSRHSRGQVLIITSGVLVALIALIGLVIDLGWYQVNALRVQRAADAAALAGVVYLPNQAISAYATARAEAVKNDYDDLDPIDVVTPVQDPGNPRRLNVTIQTRIDTFFIRVIGFNTLPVQRTASAEFVLPVPMGSPLNYYGIGCMDMRNAPSDPLCVTSGNSNNSSGVPNATTGSSVIGQPAPSQLGSQGFWGVSFTKGGDSRNGDAYLPTAVSGPTIANAEYDPSGYGYTVEIPGGGGGSVYLFDPGFCGMPVLGSGRAGTGDEWTTNMGGTNPQSVSTYFNLYDQNGTPFLLTDDTLVWGSGNLFENERQVDESGLLGTGSPQYASGSNGVTRCDRPADPNYQYHLKWWRIPVTLGAGNYRLQITTTKMVTASGGGTAVLDPSVNSNVGAANRWGLEVSSAGGNPRVYGSSRMAAYANVQAGVQTFYLAQIDRASGAGKTVDIDLYDPGDVGGGAWLEILNPDGNVYNAATFSFTSRSKAGVVGESGVNVSCIQTNHGTSIPIGLSGACPRSTNNSGSHFDSYWLRISVRLPSTYGQGGLTPGGEPAAGWWKIRYTVAGGNDTTTWAVTIRGNPVHLIPD